LNGFAFASNVDLHPFQNSLAVKLLDLVSHSTFAGDRRGFVDLIVDFIFFWPRFTFSKSDGDFTSLSILELIIPNLGELRR
jgi:hypothetical protein